MEHKNIQAFYIKHTKIAIAKYPFPENFVAYYNYYAFNPYVGKRGGVFFFKQIVG